MSEMIDQFIGWTHIIQWAVILLVGLVAAVTVIAYIYITRYTKAGPHEVLVISGRKRRLDEEGEHVEIGYRIVRGAGTFLWPFFEKVDTLSLKVISLEVSVNEACTAQGVPVIVSGTAQVKIKGDNVSIRTAAEQFLSKTEEEIRHIALQTVEGHLRAILGQMTVEELYSNRDVFAQQVQGVAASELANMGLMIVAFTIKEIRDSHGYLEALGRSRIAEVTRDAQIGEVEAERDATIRQAEARQVAECAQRAADRQVAEAQAELDSRLAQLSAQLRVKRAQEELAVEMEKKQAQKALVDEAAQIELARKERAIELQTKENERHEMELRATVRETADAEAYKIERLAEAEKRRAMLMAEAETESTRLAGQAEVELSKQRGTIEAETMAQKAQAWANYNDAALFQMFVERLPEIAEAVAAPLANTDKIVVMGNGNGNGGPSQLTADSARIMKQLPDLVEAFTGLNVREFVKRNGNPPESPEARAEAKDEAVAEVAQQG